MRSPLFLPLALLSLLASTPSFAEEKLTVANCGEAGCRCALSPLTKSEAEVLLNQPAPEGAETLVYLSGSYIWSRLSPREINLVAGGSGDCPLELFPALVPEDGEWRGTIRDKTVSQCPMGLESALQGLSDAMVFPRQIKWEGRFHPDRFRMEGAAPAIKWTQQSERHFTGEGPSVGGSSASSLVKLSVLYDARLVDPKLVKVEVQLKVRAQGVSQAVIDAAGLGKCDVTVAVDLERVGA